MLVARHDAVRRLATILACFLMLAASPALARTAVWIDTDAACGSGPLNDVDDCWALAMALASNRLAVRGVSTVFGNADLTTTDRTTRRIVRLFGGSVPPQVFVGAGQANGGLSSPAVAALQRALMKERLTVIALGPLTNISALLKARPDLASRIVRLIAVMGRRPDQIFQLSANPLIHLHDMNLRKDAAAVQRVLAAGVRITLVPFEVATKVTLGAPELDRLGRGAAAAASLANDSRAWLAMWKRFGMKGFHPFDSLAVGYAIAPELFRCARMPARLVRARLFAPSYASGLFVSRAYRTPTIVTYCHDVATGFKEMFLGVLSIGKQAENR